MSSNVAVLPNQKNYVLTMLALLGLGIVAPFFGNQFISGPIVNATLFIAVSLLGVRSAIFIGMFPSIIALSTGILAPVMVPMIPFIIFGNTLLVLAFDAGRKNIVLGSVTAAVLKFGFLFVTSNIVASLVVNQQVANKVLLIMSWPQLVTALAGAALAFGFLRAKKSFDANIRGNS